MLEIQISEAEPDLEVIDRALGAKCYVWHKSKTTMRVTIIMGGQSRMFDATKRRIRERRD